MRANKGKSNDIVSDPWRASNEDRSNSAEKKPSQKYTVELVVDLAETKTEICYRVQWYG